MGKIVRICHLTSMHEWDDDRIFQRACVGLSRNGYEVHLVALKPAQYPEIIDESMGVKIHLLDRLSGWKRRWHSSKQVVNKAIELDCSIYQFHDPDLLPHILEIRRKRPKAKIIYDIHENYAGRFANWGLPSFLGTWFRKYEKSILRKIDGYTVVSGSMKSLFQDIQKPVEITRNSTDIERLRDIVLPARENSATIITSGTHSHARNCLQTVKALAFVEQNPSNPPIFQFVGRYIENIEDEMKHQVIKDGTTAHLVLDGMAPWEDNFQRIAKAYAGCVFYADNPNNRVGIPNRLFEYMFCGIPVLVSDFPELKKVVEEAKCGLVVNSEVPEKIAEGVNWLLNHPKEAEEMGKRGKEAMEKTFGYHVDLQKLDAFYRSVL